MGERRRGERGEEAGLRVGVGEGGGGWMEEGERWGSWQGRCWMTFEGVLGRKRTFDDTVAGGAGGGKY